MFFLVELRISLLVKGIVPLKRKIPASFLHPHVVQNLHVYMIISLWERQYFVKCPWGFVYVSVAANVVFQKMIFCIPQKKESHIGFETYEGE